MALASPMSLSRFCPEKKTIATLIALFRLRVRLVKQLSQYHPRAAHAEIGRELSGRRPAPVGSQVRYFCLFQRYPGVSRSSSPAFRYRHFEIFLITDAKDRDPFMHDHVAYPAYLVREQERAAVHDDSLRPGQVEHVHQLELQQVVPGLEPSLLSLPGKLHRAFPVQPYSEPVDETLLQQRPRQYTCAFSKSEVIGLVHLRKEEFHSSAARVVTDVDPLIVEVRPA